MSFDWRIVVLLVFTVGCGRGDVSIEIKNGYEFSDSGGMEKMIIYRHNLFDEEIIIDARVDSYKTEGNIIYVARKPREIFWIMNHQIPDSKLSSICEYWEINTKSHQVIRIDKTHGLLCN